MMQRKELIRVLWISAVLWGMSGCVSTMGSEEEEEMRGDAIAFGTEVTKAVVENVNGMSDFSVWGWYRPMTGTTSVQSTNVFDATTVDRSGSYVGTQYWMPGMMYDFYALHPAGMGGGVNVPVCTDAGVLTVPDFDCKQGIDLMTAYNPGMDGTVAQTVPLTFAHELTRVRFSVTTAEDTIVISKIQFFGFAFRGSLIKNFKGIDERWSWTNTGVCVEDATPFSAAMQPGEELVLVKGQTINLLGDLLLIPQTLGDVVTGTDAVFMLTHHYKKDLSPSKTTVRVPLRLISPQWEKGKFYHYSAEFPPNPLDVNFTVSVKPWVEKKVHVDW